MKHKCEDCRHYRPLDDGEYGDCPEMGMIVVGYFESNCGFFWEKEEVDDGSVV